MYIFIYFKKKKKKKKVITGLHLNKLHTDAKVVRMQKRLLRSIRCNQARLQKKLLEVLKLKLKKLPDQSISDNLHI